MALERFTVDNLATLTNLSGAITDIDDDPDSPDGLWITSDGGGAAELIGDFENPAKSLRSGADLQEFKVLIRRSSANGGPTGGNSVSFDIQLYENAVLVSTLTSGTLGVGTAQDTVYSGTWNSSTISNKDEVEVRVLQTNGSGGNPGNRRYIDIGAIEWNADTVDARYIFIK